MKKMICALLLAQPLLAAAVTEHPDGSVTLSAEESEAAVENFTALLTERRQMEHVIKLLLQQIKEQNSVERTSGGSGTGTYECT